MERQYLIYGTCEDNTYTPFPPNAKVGTKRIWKWKRHS